MRQDRSNTAARSALRHSIAALALTSVHHLYGAWLYSSLWRAHVVLIAGATAAILFASRSAMEASPDLRRGRVARWIFVLTISVVPLLLFGVFEGFYNHLVKDALYFSGMSVEQLRRLFPPPMYEMPNDAFFELTGVLQLVPTVSVAFSLYRMLRPSRLRGPSLAPGAR